MAGVFDGLRVLEVGDHGVAYTGKLLADQGAVVTLVEPPRGHPSRWLPPYAPGTVDDVASAFFAYFYGNKRSVTLDLEHPRGAEILRALLATADVVLAGGRPSEIRGLGIEPTTAAEASIVTTVTPYGWTGPYAEWMADDLTLQAMGGLSNMGGYHDGRPLRPPGQQAYVAAGLFGAIGTAAALLSRDQSGHGQHVDVSIQESVTMALENCAQFYDFEGKVRTRHGGRQVQAGRGCYRCKDGFVYLMAGVRAEAKFWRRLLDWLEADEAPGREQLLGDKWLQRDYVESEEAKRLFNEVFGAFCAAKTKEELYSGARQRSIPLAPLNSLADVLDDEQLTARNYFQPVPSADWQPGPAVTAGAPYRMSVSTWSTRYAPSHTGADTAAVLAEIGIDLAEGPALLSEGVV